MMKIYLLYRAVIFVIGDEHIPHHAVVDVKPTWEQCKQAEHDRTTTEEFAGVRYYCEERPVTK